MLYFTIGTAENLPCLEVLGGHEEAQGAQGPPQALEDGHQRGESLHLSALHHC